MKRRYDRSGRPEDRPAPEDGEECKGGRYGSTESCRCKEVSEKTIPDMLKLMIRDLTSFKKLRRKN